MPKFNYVAMDSRGKETKGTLEVANQNEAIGRLKEMIDMPFDRPRDVEQVRADPRFTELRAHIWHQLHTARAPRTAAKQAVRA